MTQNGDLMKSVKENKLEGEPYRNGQEQPTQGTAWLESGKSVAWIRLQAKPAGHSENSNKGSVEIFGSVGSRECETLQR